MKNKKQDEYLHSVPSATDGNIEVTPKRDFHIVRNEHNFKLIKGEKIEIPKIYVPNLKTEGVI